MRLCHHIREHKERTQYIQELMRVSGNWLAFTYFDEASIKNRLHELRRRYSSKRPKSALALQEIKSLGRAHGFEIVRSL